MYRFLTCLLSSVAIPLQLLAVAYSIDRCSLPLPVSALGYAPASAETVSATTIHRYETVSDVAKWISKDPLGETGGWNLTAFCDDDPINKYDPNGLATQFYTWKDPNTGAIRYGAADTYDVFYLGFEKAVLNQEIAPWNTTYGVPFGDKALSLFEGESLKMLYGPGVAQASSMLAAFMPTAALTGATMVPGIGEGADVLILTSKSSSTRDKLFSLGSLGLSALTLGISPNFGGPVKTGTRALTESADAVGDGLSLNSRNLQNLMRTPNEAGVIREFVLDSDHIFYRVYSGDATQGKFLTAVAPKNRKFAQEALALPYINTAEFIQEVKVPAGTTLRRSRASPMNANDIFPYRRGGAEQFELLDFIDGSAFGIGRSLK